MPGQDGEPRSRQIIQVVIFKTGPGRGPDETPAVLQPGQLGSDVDPAGRPFLADDRPAFSRDRIGGREFQDVLEAVHPEEKKLPGIDRPGDVVDIMADDVVFERPAVADVDHRGFFRRRLIDKNVDNGIRPAGLGISLDVGPGIGPGLIRLEDIIGNPALVEAVKRQLGGIGRPPHGRDLVQLLAVHPAGRAALRPELFVAVGRHGLFVLSVRIGNPEVSVTVKSLGFPVGRKSLGELTASLQAAGPAADRFLGFFRGGAELGQRFPADVEAKPFPAAGECKSLAAVLPGRPDGSRFDRSLDLVLDFRIPVIAGIRFEPVLGRSRAGGPKSQQNDQESDGRGHSHGQLLRRRPATAAVRHFAENLKTVIVRYVSPGRRTVDGNSGRLGESGKCWVSRQKPQCFPYTRPAFPAIDPSRKFPE